MCPTSTFLNIFYEFAVLLGNVVISFVKIMSGGRILNYSAFDFCLLEFGDGT